MNEKTCSSHQAPKTIFCRSKEVIEAMTDQFEWKLTAERELTLKSLNCTLEIFRNIILIFACASCQHRCFLPRENHKPSIRTQAELMTVDKKMREEKLTLLRDA